MFMVYVYISMAAREGVLLLNGSRIRGWWIWHHYLSATTCIITLTLPVDSPAVERFVEGWLLWTVAQAALMLAQIQYAPAPPSPAPLTLHAPAAACAQTAGCHCTALCAVVARARMLLAYRMRVDWVPPPPPYRGEWPRPVLCYAATAVGTAAVSAAATP